MLKLMHSSLSLISSGFLSGQHTVNQKARASVDAIHQVLLSRMQSGAKLIRGEQRPSDTDSHIKLLLGVF